MMSNAVEPTKIDDAGSNSNVENPTPTVSAINRRWKREDLLNKGSLFLRGLAFFFSLLSFIIMASNKHGGWKNFDRYPEYRCLFQNSNHIFKNPLYSLILIFFQVFAGNCSSIDFVHRRTSVETGAFDLEKQEHI